MPVTAPPRPPRPGDPVSREKLEALVEALIEEARQRARRRRRIYAAVAASVTLGAVALLTVLDISLQSQDASLAGSTPSLVGAVTSPKIAYVTTTRGCADPRGCRSGLPPRRGSDPMNGKLYVMNADGSGLRLVAQRAQPRSPAWSPDGQRLAFGRRDGDGDVYNAAVHVVNVDGSGLQNLTRGGSPAWSPDGQKIAFGRIVKVAGNEALIDPEIYVMNADGSGQQNLTRNAAADGDPAWSPDGRKIAFGRSAIRCGIGGCATYGNVDLYVMNADGSGRQRLTRNPALDVFESWSPDGQKIAFRRRSKGKNWEVFVMSGDGSGQRNLTRNASHDIDAAWSPDGRRIVFRTSRHGPWEIYVMNANGSGQRRLTRTAANESHPSWSPDGRQIAFTRAVGANYELYVMNADGSGERRLTPNSPVDLWVAYSWSPAQG